MHTHRTDSHCVCLLVCCCIFSIVLDLITASGEEQSGKVNSHLKRPTPHIIPYILSCYYFLYLLFTSFQVGTFWRLATSLRRVNLFRADGVCMSLTGSALRFTVCASPAVQSLILLPSLQPLVARFVQRRLRYITLDSKYFQPPGLVVALTTGTPDCLCFTASSMQWLNSWIQYLQCSVTDDAHFRSSESAAVLCSRQSDSALNLCFLFYFFVFPRDWLCITGECTGFKK